MDLSNAKPEDVIEPEYLDAYKKLLKDIWMRLVHIDASITIIETISHYPLEKIYPLHRGVFWVMVYWNFMYSSIVLLHGLVNDEGADALTIQRLQGIIRQKWLKEEDDIKNSFKKKLKEVKFSSEIQSACKQIKQMRHNVVAHRVFDPEQGHLLEISGVSFPQLKEVFQSTKKVLDVCSFGVEYHTCLYEPLADEQDTTADDVVEILDLVFKNSDWLKQPERDAEFWGGIRQYKDKKELEELNRWRVKYGFPPA